MCYSVSGAFKLIHKKPVCMQTFIPAKQKVHLEINVESGQTPYWVERQLLATPALDGEDWKTLVLL